MGRILAIVSSLACLGVFLLLCTAKAGAADEGLVVGYPKELNSVYKCTDGFNLRRTQRGFLLSGIMDAPGPAYTYDIAPVETLPGREGHTTLTMTGPTAAETDGKSTDLAVNSIVPAEQGLMSRLDIDVVKDYPSGTDEIRCVQVGGSQ